MIIIIPIGGIGQRFKDNNYKNPKALINIFGKPILYYLLDNLNIEQVEYVYIPYNKEYKNYNFEERLKKDYPNITFKFYSLENNTRGAAETINIALKNLNEDEDKPILCLDSDSFYLCDVISEWNSENCVFTFEDYNKDPIYSYVKISKNNDVFITDIKEKEKISNYACTGAYGFNSYKILLEYTQFIIDNNIRQKNEYYTSGVIKKMINDKHKFKNKTVNKKLFFTLGTPKEINIFYDKIIKEKIEERKKIMLPIVGHSNFNINIINMNNNYYLCKSSNNYNDALRLIKQIDKQESHNKLFDFKTPEIYYKSEIAKDNKNCFMMEYMNNCTDCFTYIQHNHFFAVEKLFIFLKKIIEKYILSSTYKKIDNNTLLDKILSIKQHIITLNSENIFTESDNKVINKSLNYLENKSNEICNIQIPIGFCHGDLTLSNMLFDEINNELYLIDFLDSFIESPIIDIVKLRQDTKFFWTIQMCNMNIDNTKIKIIMNYLDSKIDKFYSQYSFYKLSYKYFEIMNLLRVLQYCKSVDIKNYLINCLRYK